MRVAIIFRFVVVIAAMCKFVECESDEPGAIWMPSQFHTTGRGGDSVKYIILGGSWGYNTDTDGAKSIGYFFRMPTTKASTHYTVGRDGLIVQSVREGDCTLPRAKLEAGADPWWTSDFRTSIISINLVKDTGNYEEITEVQKRASFKLIKDIIARHPGIKKRPADSSGGITGEFSIAPIVKRMFPGPYPWAELYEEIQERPQIAEAREESTTPPPRVQVNPPASHNVHLHLKQDTTINNVVTGPAPENPMKSNSAPDQVKNNLPNDQVANTTSTPPDNDNSGKVNSSPTGDDDEVIRSPPDTVEEDTNKSPKDFSSDNQLDKANKPSVIAFLRPNHVRLCWGNCETKVYFLASKS